MGGAFSTRGYDDKFIQDCSRKGKCNRAVDGDEKVPKGKDLSS